MENINISFYKDYMSILETHFLNKKMVIIECVDNLTQKHVAVLCALETDATGTQTLIPYAKLFDSNPFELVTPTNTNKILKQSELNNNKENIYQNDIRYN